MIENNPLSREIISHNQTPQAEKVSAKAIDIPLESSRGDASRYAELYRSTRKLQAAPRNLRVGEGAASLSLAQVRTPGHPPRFSLYSECLRARPLLRHTPPICPPLSTPSTTCMAPPKIPTLPRVWVIQLARLVFKRSHGAGSMLLHQHLLLPSLLFPLQLLRPCDFLLSPGSVLFSSCLLSSTGCFVWRPSG